MKNQKGNIFLKIVLVIFIIGLIAVTGIMTYKAFELRERSRTLYAQNQTLIQENDLLNDKLNPGNHKKSSTDLRDGSYSAKVLYESTAMIIEYLEAEKGEIPEGVKISLERQEGDIYIFKTTNKDESSWNSFYYVDTYSNEIIPVKE